MPSYDVTATIRYQCRDDAGHYLPIEQTVKTYQLDAPGADELDYDLLYSLIDADLPDTCVSRTITGLTVAPSAYGPGVDEGIGESPPDDRPTGTPGQLVTVYATVALENTEDGSIVYRTIRVDVFWDITVGDLIAALYEAAEAMIAAEPSKYPYIILGITITAPAYFQYLTVA